MFIPNTKCQFYKRTGNTLYGKAAYAPPVTLPCGIVQLQVKTATTSVRSDTTGSRGAAQDDTAQSKILFPASATLVQGDLVKFNQFQLIVASVQPRLAISGQVDHWEVTLKISTDNLTGPKKMVL